MVLFLTALPLFLACWAFVLQWRGALDSPRNSPGWKRAPRPVRLLVDAQALVIVVLRLRGDSGQNSFPSFPYCRGWNFGFESVPHPKISIVSTTSATLEQLLPWLFYHKVIGVAQFFLFVEGKAAKPHVSAILESISGVKVIHRTKHLEEKQAQSRIWNETWLAGFFYKPCNYELFMKQSLNMEMAIVMAWESCIERDDIKDPFSDVSMFKKNYDHLPKDTYFGMHKEAIRGNPNYFLTYGNGKSAARIQDHLHPNGAHRWHNYMKTPNEVKVEDAAVLHFTYAKFSDLTSRRDRCSCKPTKDDVKRCYMLAFDRDAFIIASTATPEEMLQWYNDHIVWRDQELIIRLLKKGVLTHICTNGLRESSICNSAIASAQTLSKQKFLSMEDLQNKNSSTLPDSSTGASKTTTRGAGGNESLAAGTKILETAVFTENAIPPTSPLG